MQERFIPRGVRSLYLRGVRTPELQLNSRDRASCVDAGAGLRNIGTAFQPSTDRHPVCDVPAVLYQAVPYAAHHAGW
jgi:hypothetical protein